MVISVHVNIQMSVAARANPQRDGVFKPERGTDRNHPVPRFQSVRIPQRRHWILVIR